MHRFDNLLRSGPFNPPDPFDGDKVTYYIMNVQTGDNATQLGDIDRSESVTTNEKADHGSQVNLCILEFEVFLIIL
jgi:hypothetical protein